MCSKQLAVLVLIASSLLGQASAIDIAQETRAVEQWRTERVTNLTSATGWLTLVGLYWLQEGENTFGRSKSNTLQLDHATLPATLGTFVRQGNRVSFTARPTSAVTHEGKPIRTIDMTSDANAAPTTLTAGTVQFFLIDRAGRLGIRVRDTAHAARTEFTGIDYFPISSAWVIDAKFEAHKPTRRIAIVNVLGMTEQMISPGALVFQKDGRQYRLDTVLEVPDDDELFIMFADATTARETYGAGRYLYVPLPSNGRITVDFNKAYNPPCAFNDFATCPLPPQQNRLPLRVEAGEKKYSAR
ncbi:MAG: DUF1684 domain-containing protein [Candidatus Obscuribacterales bacterium]|nr:DUF1684 domain-containing protein [Steroidobacteraceae bacterium]